MPQTNISFDNKIVKNVFLYITPENKFCVAIVDTDKIVAKYVTPVNTSNPKILKPFVFDTIEQANNFLRDVYPHIHPEAHITNITKYFKDQKIKNQTNNTEYRYFFRPEFNRIWKPENGYTEWPVDTSDICTEYKELFGQELLFEYKTHEEEIQKIKDEKQTEHLKKQQEQKYQEKEILKAERRAKYKLGLPERVVLFNLDPKKYIPYNVLVYLTENTSGKTFSFSDINEANNFLKLVYFQMKSPNCYVAHLAKSKYNPMFYFFEQEDIITKRNNVDLSDYVPFDIGRYWCAKKHLESNQPTLLQRIKQKFISRQK